MVSLLALVALASLPAAFAQFMINTPSSATQCQPTKLSWTGGTGPFFLSILPGGQPSAPPLETLPNQNGQDFTWTVDLATGTAFTISLKDSSGAQAFSDIVTVQSSGDSSCVGKGGASGSAAPTSTGASSGGAPSGTAPATTPGASSAPAPSSVGASSRPSSAATSASSGSARPSAASGSSTPSATPSNAALNTKGNAIAMAGVMGLVGAVLF